MWTLSSGIECTGCDRMHDKYICTMDEALVCFGAGMQQLHGLERREQEVASREAAAASEQERLQLEASALEDAGSGLAAEQQQLRSAMQVCNHTHHKPQTTCLLPQG